MSRIIISADDFGFDEDTTEATIESFESGVLKNASLMANMDATKLAADYAADNPQFSWGVHLTFTRDTTEEPVLPSADVPSLIGPDGLFLEGRAAQIKALTGRFPVDEIANEMSAQIGRLRDLGVKIDYVDSHKHLHKFPNFTKALVKVLPTFGISLVRNVQNVFVPAPSKTRPTVLLGGALRRPLVARWRTTDQFFMGDGDTEFDWWDKVPMPDPEHVLEVGGHPGINEPWRAHEATQLAKFAERAEHEGAQLIRWRDL